MDPVFLLMRFHLMASSPFYFENDLYIYLFLENDLESPIIFVLFLKVNKIRKKILSVTSYLEKAVCEKPNMGSGARLLIGNVR